MSIYTARSASVGGKAPTSEFIERGIEGLVQTTLSECQVWGSPNVRQLSYDVYKSNFSAFMLATVHQEKVLCAAEGHVFSEIQNEKIPLESPTAIILFPTKIEAKKRVKIMAKLDLEEIPSSKQDGKFMPLRLTKISTEKAKLLATLGVSMFNKAGQGITNLSGLMSFNKAADILTAALATQFYPADKGDGKIAVAEDIDIQGFENMSMNVEKTEKQEIDVQEKDPNDENQMVVVKKTVDRKFKVREDNPKRKKLVRGTISSAKPAIYKPSQNYGPVSGIPHMPGLLFPYFDGLLKTDPQFIARTLVKDSYLRSFGKDREDVLNGFRDFKLGAQDWAATLQGHRLSHAWFIMDLALTCQARPYLIIENGKYLGGLLLGDSLRMML